MIISHLYYKNNQWTIQSNEEHTQGVSQLASRFAGEFGMSLWGEILGELHDKGKESNAFQQHIKKESGYEIEIEVAGNYHHSYVGAVIARKLYGKTYDNFLVNQILSHHSGLHDSDEIELSIEEELKQNRNKEIPLEIVEYDKKIELKLPFKVSPMDFHHLARVLYSCLVDADYLDTESFMDAESANLRKQKTTLDSLLPMLERKLCELKAKAAPSSVNDIRNQVQQQCLLKSETPVGFYSLTVPTGGGKTLSSLLWAMRHAIRNGQRRIIIAIPYTSIIIQTASVLRSIFGEENVLEHHSNVNPECK